MKRRSDYEVCYTRTRKDGSPYSGDVKDILPMKIGDTVSLYICDAITHVKPKINVSPANDVGRQLLDWISDLLDRKFSLEEWLRDNHGGVCQVTDKADYFNKLQVTRHAWLQWMIQEIKTNNKL